MHGRTSVLWARGFEIRSDDGLLALQPGLLRLAFERAEKLLAFVDAAAIGITIKFQLSNGRP